MTLPHTVPLGHHVIHVHDYWHTDVARYVDSLRGVPCTQVITAPDTAQIRELATDWLGPADVVLHTRAFSPVSAHLDNWTHAALARNPTDLLIDRADWLRPEQLRYFLCLATQADARLWLFTNPGVNDTIAELIVAHAGTSTLSHAGFCLAWADREVRASLPTADGQPAAEPELVQDAHFLQFTQACDRLPAAQRVLALQQREIGRVTGHRLAADLASCADGPDQARSNRSRRRSATLAHHLTGLLIGKKPATALARLRGLELGMFESGWLYLARPAWLWASPELAFERPPLTALPPLKPNSAAHLAPATLFAAGFSEEEIGRILVASLGPRGDWARVDGQQRSLPSWVHTPLAQARLDLLDSVGPHGSLGSWSRGQAYFTELSASTTARFDRQLHPVGRYRSLSASATDGRVLNTLLPHLIPLNQRTLANGTGARAWYPRFRNALVAEPAPGVLANELPLQALPSQADVSALYWILRSHGPHAFQSNGAVDRHVAAAQRFLPLLDQVTLATPRR